MEKFTAVMVSKKADEKYAHSYQEWYNEVGLILSNRIEVCNKGKRVTYDEKGIQNPNAMGYVVIFKDGILSIDEECLVETKRKPSKELLEMAEDYLKDNQNNMSIKNNVGMSKFKVGDKVVTDHSKDVYEVIEVNEKKNQYKLSGISGWWSEWQLEEAETNMSIKDKKGAYEFKNSNLRFHGMKMDINGNPCFVLSTPNQRAFSVQQPYSISIHWKTKGDKSLSSKESGSELVEKITKGNPFNSAEEFESYVLDLTKDRKHVKIYGNNFACGKSNMSIGSIINNATLNSDEKKEYKQDGNSLIAIKKSSKKNIYFRWNFNNKMYLVGFEKRIEGGTIELFGFYEDICSYTIIKDNLITLDATIGKDGFELKRNNEVVENKRTIQRYKNKLLEYREILSKKTLGGIKNELEREGYKQNQKLEVNFSIIDDTKNFVKKIFDGGILMF